MSKSMHRLVHLIELATRKPVYAMSEKDIAKYNNLQIPDNIITRKIFGKPAILSGKQEFVIPVREGEIAGTWFLPQKKPDTVNPKTPALLYFHGGGWVLSTIAIHTLLCGKLSGILGIPVLSIEYRLAPEYKFPTAAEDAYDSLVWLHNHADELMVNRDLIYVMGSSSGGNLAAVVSLMARDRQGPKIRGQILNYPLTDGRMLSKSHKMYEKGPILTKKDIEFYITSYSNTKDDIYNPYFSPLLAENHADIPDTLIITAEYDPLLDDGAQYAEALRKAGVSVTYYMCRQTIHASLLYPKATGTKEAVLLISNFISKE